MIRKSCLYVALTVIMAAASVNALATTVSNEADQSDTDAQSAQFYENADLTLNKNPSQNKPHQRTPHKPQVPRPPQNPGTNPGPQNPPGNQNKPSPEPSPEPSVPPNNQNKPNSDKPSSAAPVTLNSIRDIVDALRNGYSVAVDMDIAKCQSPDSGPVDKAGTARFGSRIDGYVINSDRALTFSHLSYSAAKRGLEVLTRNLTDYTVNQDGSVSVEMTAFNSLGYKKGKTTTYSCRINKGVVFKGE